jgi:5-methylcytosine-specific restriction protein B
MERASPSAQQLTAEMLWALLLFPSNMRAKTKRQQVRDIWGLSGRQLPSDLPLLGDEVLAGIGSGGPGFNNYRPQELEFLIALMRDLKKKAAVERRQIMTDYDAFIDWINLVPREGSRQFRHMLRFFAFPDRVERMSSNRDRRSILEALNIASKKDVKTWTDRQLDEALFKLRTELQKKNPSEVLDFYNPSLKERWSPDADVADDGEDTGDSPEAVSTGVASPTQWPVNLILYGPPGTGKTHWLRQKFGEYTDEPSAVDHNTWLQELLTNYGWRSVIATALAELGRPARVPEIRDCALVQAKAKQRGRIATSIQPTLWNYLQEHTPEAVSTVKTAIRRPPFIFSKSESGDWELLPEWHELDEESAELERFLRAGPSGAHEPIRRYRVVTFHPSFGYEDFVRGIRPIANAEDGTTQFCMVDGIFKQICDEARANPAKRYALFIDEINRANIAKVFGELITLIESDKRGVFDASGRLTQGMMVQLPGGDGTDVAEPAFAVPANLDIYGTMNTADRSIALLDIALRRRFEFQEMEPDYSLLDRFVANVHLGDLLRRINDRLEYLLDRDHRVGHAYLMSVKDLADLRRVLRVQIIPLLQEYFFDDLARVALVVATGPSAPPIIVREWLRHSDLFSSARPEGVLDKRSRYVVTNETTWTEESFLGIYLFIADDTGGPEELA